MRFEKTKVRLTTAVVANGSCITPTRDPSYELCVVLHGYQSPLHGVAWCRPANEGGVLNFSPTLPYGTTSLACAVVMLDEPARNFSRQCSLTNACNSDERTQLLFNKLMVEEGGLLEGLSFPDGQPSNLNVFPKHAYQLMGHKGVLTTATVQFAVEGTQLRHALRWSGWSASWPEKVRNQTEILAPHVRARDPSFRMLEVGCGALAVGSRLIDEGMPSSYTCVDVVVWPALFVVQHGIRVDLLQAHTSGTDMRVARTDLRRKHPHIVADAACGATTQAAHSMDLIFGFRTFIYFACDMLLSCLRSLVYLLRPGGKVLVELNEHGSGLAELPASRAPTARLRRWLMLYPAPADNTCANQTAVLASVAAENGLQIKALHEADRKGRKVIRWLMEAKT